MYKMLELASSGSISVIKFVAGIKISNQDRAPIKSMHNHNIPVKCHHAKKKLDKTSEFSRRRLFLENRSKK